MIKAAADTADHLSPGRRAWRRFRASRRGTVSLWVFTILFGLSLFAELLSNDKPLMVYYQLLRGHPGRSQGIRAHGWRQ